MQLNSHTSLLFHDDVVQGVCTADEERMWHVIDDSMLRCVSIREEQHFEYATVGG
jgi:hypothetical protein